MTLLGMALTLLMITVLVIGCLLTLVDYRRDRLVAEWESETRYLPLALITGAVWEASSGICRRSFWR